LSFDTGYLQTGEANRPSQGAPQGFDGLDRIAIAYLGLPALIFLCGWLKWWAGLPLALLLVLGSRALWSGWAAGSKRIPIDLSVGLLVLAVAVGWSALGGAGHLFFANFDWVTRDSVLRDLVVGSWPVGYGEVDAASLLLRAPIGYYLPAALVGKTLGLGTADLALLLWTIIGVALFLALAVSRVAGLRAATVVVLVLVFFSGMDLPGTVLRGGLQLASHLQITDHLEWWAGRFQYSSTTTQLFWVPNHALAGWIATALLVRHADHPGFARILPLLVAILPIWSPLTAVGFLPLAGVWWVQQLLRDRTLRLVDPLALAAALAIALVTGAYLVMGAAEIHSGVTAMPGESLLFYVPHYLQFVLLEGGILWLLLLALRPNGLLIVAGLLLWVLPFASFGPSNDLAMRGSIPALVVLALAAASAVASPALALQRRVFWPIVVVLLLGVPTAITEMARAASEPVWKPDYSHSLVPDPRKEYPAHYATRLDDSPIVRLLRPVGNVNGMNDTSGRRQPGAGDER
jgi:hypothetical protein